ncbi:hypothetical protein [Curtobacterium flaccumfaciens]|uniref:hypothetical protein n=1 Tax=Curtobacterium flaccumfaciens TaxID=2035 RepID=UPI00188A2569|nr:hypothetical protein [Curtobacterium flaccumfaciens]MBF4628329.1 hypothetical protein [Curtobacterium flaccumfaciens]
MIDTRPSSVRTNPLLSEAEHQQIDRIVDDLDIRGRGIAELYTRLRGSAVARASFEAKHGVRPLLWEPEDFALQMGLILHLRNDAPFVDYALKRIMAAYDRDEADATSEGGLDTVAELRLLHWGPDLEVQRAGRTLLARICAGAASPEEVAAAMDRWGASWMDLTEFRATTVQQP